MKNVGYLFLLLLILSACQGDNGLEREIAQIPVDFDIERFDLAFGHAQPADLPQLKAVYPFFFPSNVKDSVWVTQMEDSLQQELHQEVEKTFSNMDDVRQDVKSLFQHLKFYDPQFKVPRVITLTSNVDYRNKTIVTDTLVLIALDTYLGSEHPFYEGIQKFLSQNMKREMIASDMAGQYAHRYITQAPPKTLLDDMIYAGKELYFKDKMIPFKSDAFKIGYLPEQMVWAVENESEIWRYLVERQLLYSTDNSLAGRFIADAPFTKFYLELDNESPGRLGQYMGWQIVRSFMKHNEVDFLEMMAMDAETIFNQSKFKPRK